MSLKTGDKVIIIAGKNKGSRGKIIKILKNDKVIVEGFNMIKKHVKPNANNQSGAIVSKEAPIHISNVMLIDSKTDKGTRKRTDEVRKEVKKETKKEVEKETKVSKPKTKKTKLD